ncbi:hypothetical protein PgNI_11068 [Pyricularia grisea]|uniref:Uncharacterized protein n=1 Tax=Pyricularia grisea TaxID=148305 RepID=A0A6P8AZA7_PYRGI|nr:hypothetical protein PgNI_11068 [Pyricularia grisea]TLD07670.1 hypothetical protein PgNI_11068 [Pyricularia grisea]
MENALGERFFLEHDTARLYTSSINAGNTRRHYATVPTASSDGKSFEQGYMVFENITPVQPWLGRLCLAVPLWWRMFKNRYIDDKASRGLITGRLMYIYNFRGF